MNAAHRFAQTSHGRIHYLDTGTTKRPLVLLHSNGCSAYEYEGVVASLAEHHRVIAWDMPGHGDSGPIARHYPIKGYTDALIELLDATGIKSAHVLGSSVGGTICMDLGVRYADRLNGLIITETPTRSFEDWGKIWGAVEATFATMPVTLADITPRFRVTPDAALLARWNYDRNKTGARVMMDVMWALREFDAAAALPKITVPAMVLFGAKGPVLDGQAMFAKLLPSAKQVILPDCGHFPMIDDPDAFAEAVLAFTTTR